MRAELFLYTFVHTVGSLTVMCRSPALAHALRKSHAPLLTLAASGALRAADHVFLDDVHGLRISIREHEGRWPISTVKHIES